MSSKNLLVDKVVDRSLKIVQRNNTTPTIRGTSFCLGNYENLYGHMLLDSFSRAWLLAENKDLFQKIDRFVLCDIRRKGARNVEVNIRQRRRIAMLSDAFRVLLKAFDPNYEKPILLLRIPTHFQKIIIPDAALKGFLNPRRTFPLENVVHPNMKKVFSKMRDFYHVENKEFSGKIYISRYRHTQKQIQRKPVRPGNANHISPFVRHCENEIEVERYFQSMGFRVVYLEEMGIVQQINLFSNCRYIAGFGGTGLHNIVFCFPSITLINLGDPRWPEAKVEPNMNQKSINFLVERLKQVYVPTKFITVSKTIHRVDVGSIRSFLKTKLPEIIVVK